MFRPRLLPLRIPLLIILTAICLACFSSAGYAQTDEVSDMELIERVEQLQNQLVAPQIPKRDEAEKELIDLGVRVLDALAPLTNDSSTDLVARINRVRVALEKEAIAAATAASVVSLQGSLTLDEALESLARQSQNDVALLDGTPDVFVTKLINLDIKNAGFWDALHQIMEQGELMIDTYGGQAGALRLTPTSQARIRAANPEGKNLANSLPKKEIIPGCTSGIFDMTVTKVVASRNLENPQANYCNIGVRIRWEPRMKPISLDLPMKTVKAIDEYNHPVLISDPNAVQSGMVQPEIPELEFFMPISLVDRQVEYIKSLDAEFQAVLPGRVESFRFEKIGDLQPGARQTKAGATLTFDGIRKNEDLFGVSIRLSFDEEHNALESHQSWVYDNPFYLEDSSGNQVLPLTLESNAIAQNEVAFTYYFEENPDAMSIFYQTPAAIIKVPIKLSIENVPFP